MAYSVFSVALNIAECHVGVFIRRADEISSINVYEQALYFSKGCSSCLSITSSHLGSCLLLPPCGNSHACYTSLKNPILDTYLRYTNVIHKDIKRVANCSDLHVILLASADVYGRSTELFRKAVGLTRIIMLLVPIPA